MRVWAWSWGLRGLGLRVLRGVARVSLRKGRRVAPSFAVLGTSGTRVLSSRGRSFSRDTT